MVFEFEKIKQALKHPERQLNDYGFKVEAIREPEFSLTHRFFKKGDYVKFQPRVSDFDGGVLYLESGNINLKYKVGSMEFIRELPKGTVFRLPRSSHSFQVSASVDSSLYSTSGKGRIDSPLIEQGPTQTFYGKDTYWGRIENFVVGDFAGKRIFMKGRESTMDGNPSQSSLEYHLQKKEAYYLQEGELEVGLRTNRAINRSLLMYPGDVLIIPQGFMHMRIAHKDTVIIEVSTRDSDDDTNLVEEGKLYQHKPIETYSLHQS